MKYFNPAEFMCHHCGENKMDAVFLAEIDALRGLCGFPLSVTSGYRCPTHNQAVSTTGPNGPHTTGRAVDFGVRGAQALEVIKHAMAMGFTGIGVQQKGVTRFIHIDNLPNAPGQPRPTIWSY
jgi:zinc D-Ala-D-Ala carboxypeptidase